jgi:lysozyme
MAKAPDKIQPMESQGGGSGKAKAVGIIGAAALAISAPLVAKWEGKRNDPYRDIVGVPTVCYGDTRDVTMGKRVGDAECTDRLYRQLADHAAPIIKCVPALRQPGRTAQLAASVSLAYNIGTTGFCKSTAARRFNAGDWRGGCSAFYAWRFAGGREVKGLANRRRDEIAICLRGL